MGRSLHFIFSKEQENQGGDEAIDFLLAIDHIWLISVLVLISMTLQLILVFGGARRHQSSKRLLALSMWLTYMSADGVATYALGAMLHSSRTRILYALWAPLLLLHLGGPDCMTAYSIRDNELWKRHLINMIYQSGVTIYVILCAIQLEREKGDWLLFAAAIIVLISGATKYAERVIALWLASYNKITESTQPIYQFMKDEHHLDQERETFEGICNYLVVGEERWFDEFSGGGFKWSTDSLIATGAVTVRDVWVSEGEDFTDNYVLCLAFALFKMYKRRYAHLYFHEVDQPKTKTFLLNAGHEILFKLLERELKFMYDMLFSKSVTYSCRRGTLMRLLNAILLGVAWFLMLRGLEDAQAHLNVQERVVAHTLISVAFLLEVFQLCRIMVSDWTMVWLICLHIRLFRRPRLTDRFLSKIMKMLIWVIRLVRRNLCLENQYWQNKIQQCCVLDACIPSSPLMLSAYKFCIKKDSLKPWYVKCRTNDSMESWYIRSEPIERELKTFLFQQIRFNCELVDLDDCKKKNFNFDNRSYLQMHNDLMWAIECDFELQILSWHIATSICEREDLPSHRDRENIGFSRTLSRYCAYLIVSCTNILPLHPHIAKLMYKEIHSDVADMVRNDHAACPYPDFYRERLRYFDLNDGSETKGTALDRGIKIASQLRKLPVKDRWELLGQHWCFTVLYIAAYNKTEFHAERLSFGGEFLTQIWTLLGHMGISPWNLQ